MNRLSWAVSKLLFVLGLIVPSITPVGAQSTAFDSLAAFRLTIVRDSIYCTTHPVTGPKCTRARVRLDSVRTALLTGTAAPTPVASVIVTLTQTSIFVGATTQATALPRDSLGHTLTGRIVTWSSSDTAKARVTSTAAYAASVFGRGVGTSSIIATCEGITGYAVIVVATPAPLPVATVTVTLDSASILVGATTVATAVTRDSTGAIVTGRVIDWTVSDTTKVTLAGAGATLVATGVDTGTVSIFATSESIVGFAVIRVRLVVAAVASVTVSLGSSSLVTGATTVATAVTRDASSVVLVGRLITWASSNAAVATVTGSGSSVTVTATGVGTDTVTATSESIPGTATLVVVTVAPPPSGVTLPDVPQDTVPVTFPTVSGTTFVVHNGDNLQAKLDSAVRGDEVVIDAAARFTGNFILKAKSGAGWVLIRSSGLASLTAGTRVAPADSVHMPVIITNNSTAALKTATSGAAGGYYLAGIDIESTCCTYPSVNFGILLLGDGTSAQNTVALVPDSLVLDRVYVHGFSTTNLARCVGYNAGRTAIFDSYIAECHAKGSDSQAIGGWNGLGPIRVSNTRLQGAGENVLFGGADPAVPLARTADVTFNRDYFDTPAAWKGVWTKKNLFEMKNSLRVEVKNSVFEGNWVDGQTGIAWILKSVNQSGGCNWCGTTDVWMHDNIVAKSSGFLNLAGNPDNNFPVVSSLKRVLIEQNIFEDSVNVTPYTGDGRFILLLNLTSDVTLRNNTLRSSFPCTSFMAIGPGSSTGPTNIAQDVNIFGRCTYGITGDNTGQGSAALALIHGVNIFTYNAIIGTANATYPATTTFDATITAAEAHGGGANRTRVAAATAGVK